MAYKVGYFLRANQGVYGVIARHLPSDATLITLATKDPQEEIERAHDVDFLIAVKCTREMIRGASRLRLIQVPGVGYDQVDVEAARAARVPIALTLAGTAEAVAEHTILLMLAVCRRLVELANSVKAGNWLMWDRRLQSRDLRGMTLGLIGMGRVGQEVAARAADLQMKVQYYDPRRVSSYHYVDLDELLRSSDVVSIHVPLTPETRNLIDRRRIAQMKREVYLINTARGEIVDEAALCEALQSGWVAGAGLDVLAKEPPDPQNPLLQLDQVIITPHIAAGTLDSLQAKAQSYAANIERVLAGEAPEGLLHFSAAS
jgi:D-3-phosphoglycerate dehydrogenase